MFSRLLGRAAPASRPAGLLPDSSRSNPGYDALPRFDLLAADLAAARSSTRPRWKEGRLFFFDRRRQAELESAGPATQPTERVPELSARITAELPALFASVELRQVARAVRGLRAGAAALAPAYPAAKELADLLAVPDDEVVTVLHPAARTGFRVVVSGVADVGQFHILLADATAGAPVPRRFVAACRDVNPTTAAGVPMVAEAQFQMYTPAALRPDGTLPPGFGGSEYWLWPNAPLASALRIDGERVVLLGPPAFPQTWDIARRFPAMAADVRMLEALSPFRVAERLEKLVGGPASPTPAAVKAA